MGERVSAPRDRASHHPSTANDAPRSPINHQPSTITPVRFRELAAVARLQQRAFRPGLAYRLGTLATLWAVPGIAFLVARRDGEVVGCAIGDVNDGNSRVVNIAVDPAWRRRGIATALLAAIEDALPRGDMLLMVEADNPGAKALYERCGYHDAGPAPNYYGGGRDGIWMRKPRPGGVPKLRV